LQKRLIILRSLCIAATSKTINIAQQDKGNRKEKRKQNAESGEFAVVEHFAAVNALQKAFC